MDGWMDRDMAAAVDNIYPSKRAAAALQFKEKKRVAGEARRRGERARRL